jgi:hypothetical protein
MNLQKNVRTLKEIKVTQEIYFLEKYAILQKPTIKQNCKLIEKKVY